MRRDYNLARCQREPSWDGASRAARDAPGGVAFGRPNSHTSRPSPKGPVRAQGSLVHLELRRRATKTVELLKRKVVNNEGHDGGDLKTSYFWGVPEFEVSIISLLVSPTGHHI